jgi:hypothetical protein
VPAVLGCERSQLTLDGVACQPHQVLAVRRSFSQDVADQLASVAPKPQVSDWQDEYLASRESDQDEYLESLLAEKNTVYLD